MVNVTTISGRLTKEPELKHTSTSGAAYVFASLAFDTFFKKEKEVNFIKIKMWGRTAELTADYCHKGSLVTVTGQLKLERWEGREGAKHETNFIDVREIDFPPKQKDAQPQRRRRESEQRTFEDQPPTQEELAADDTPF